MNEFVELTEDQFVDLYKPIGNHLDPNASFDWGDGIGTLFETYGDEAAFVKSQRPESIWTLLDCDGRLYIVSGWHYVNRLGYFITSVSVPSTSEITVTLDDDVDA